MAAKIPKTRADLLDGFIPFPSQFWGIVTDLSVCFSPYSLNFVSSHARIAHMASWFKMPSNGGIFGTPF
jgi:hypothetical protein